MLHSIFAIEVCMRLDPGSHVLPTLRAVIAKHPHKAGYQEKWSRYRTAATLLVEQSHLIEKGCWDYFDDDERAKKDYEMWTEGMTTEEGARTSPSGATHPYRGEARFMALTMAFLLEHDSSSDLAMSNLCRIPEPDLWKRETFVRILRGMGVMSFNSVKSDIIYLIPRDDGWGLTADDLADPKFEYLRPVVG